MLTKKSISRKETYRAIRYFQPQEKCMNHKYVFGVVKILSGLLRYKLIFNLIINSQKLKSNET